MGQSPNGKSPVSANDRSPVVDGLKAATALENDLVLVARNANDVARTGVETLEPFELSCRGAPQDLTSKFAKGLLAKLPDLCGAGA